MNDQSFDKILRGRLYRYDCPEPQALSDFHLGLTNDEAAATVARHLTRCPHCEAEVAQLADFLAPPATERLAAGFRLLVARLSEGLNLDGGPMMAPTMAFRGPNDVTQTYSTPEHQIALSFNEDIEQPDKFALDGFLIGVEQTDIFKADLWHDESWLATTYVDDLGNFTFSGLPEAIYELIVRGPRLEIHIVSLAP